MLLFVIGYLLGILTILIGVLCGFIEFDPPRERLWPDGHNHSYSSECWSDCPKHK